MMEYGSLIARVCLSVVFLWSGITKLRDPAGGIAEIAALHLPAPRLFLVLTILCQIGAGLMVLLGFWTRLAALALLGFTVIATCWRTGPRVSRARRGSSRSPPAWSILPSSVVSRF